jgi:very-short-patch-repair endonuclease
MHPEKIEAIKEAAQRRRGVSVFNVDPVSQDRCIKLLRDCVGNLQVVDLASTDPLLFAKTLIEQGHLFINAIRSCVEPRSKFIYRRIVELYRFHRFPIYFLSRDPEESFLMDSLWNAQENTVDETLLFLELIPQVLQLAGHVFPSPTHLLDHPIEELKWTTPIEKILAEALAEKGFGFISQYRVGRYQVDFLVTREDRKDFVECDGAAFHSTSEAKARDSARDGYIQRETGVPIIRLTGSELFRNPRTCVEKR